MLSKTDKFYNNFSFFYPLVDFFLIPQKRSLFSHINALPPGKLLDIGVGNGRHLHHYQKHIITGIDSSEKMLQAAKKKNNKVELLQMNGEQLLFPDHSFDNIVLSHVIAVVENPQKLLEETYRVLKPGGQLFILNHFTPTNRLRHIDTFFQRFAKMFHFRSVFHISDYAAIQQFRILKEIKFRPAGYFKLLIYSKP